MKRTPWVLKAVPCHIVSSYVTIKNTIFYMTERQEEMIAAGKNWEHTKGAIQSNKLELLFGVFKTWTAAIQDLATPAKPTVI